MVQFENQALMGEITVFTAVSVSYIMELFPKFVLSRGLTLGHMHAVHHTLSYSPL